MTEGKSLFSPDLYTAIQLYLEYRAKDVLAKRITEGRLSSIKSHIKWLTKYPAINTEHRLDTLGEKQYTTIHNVVWTTVRLIKHSVMRIG